MTGDSSATTSVTPYKGRRPKGDSVQYGRRSMNGMRGCDGRSVQRAQTMLEPSKALSARGVWQKAQTLGSICMCWSSGDCGRFMGILVGGGKWEGETQLSLKPWE